MHVCMRVCTHTWNTGQLVAREEPATLRGLWTPGGPVPSCRSLSPCSNAHLTSSPNHPQALISCLSSSGFPDYPKTGIKIPVSLRHRLSFGHVFIPPHPGILHWPPGLGTDRRGRSRPRPSSQADQGLPFSPRRFCPPDQSGSSYSLHPILASTRWHPSVACGHRQEQSQPCDIPTWDPRPPGSG